MAIAQRKDFKKFSLTSEYKTLREIPVIYNKLDNIFKISKPHTKFIVIIIMNIGHI